jgi:hypothetical protein
MSDYAYLWGQFVTLYHVAVIGIATGAISLFVTKSALLNSFHEWLEERSPFLEKLLSCPWCTSHWVGAFFLLVYQPLILDWTDRPSWVAFSPLNYLVTPVDWLVTLMAIVAFAVAAAGAMHRAVRSM